VRLFLGSGPRDRGFESGLPDHSTPTQRPAVGAIVFGVLRISVPRVGSLRRPGSASALTLISRIINPNQYVQRFR